MRSRLQSMAGLISAVAFLAMATAAARGQGVEVKVCRLGALPIEKHLLYRPSDLTYARGVLYIADSGNNRIVAIDSLGHTIRTYGGAGSGVGEFISPQSVSVSAHGLMCVADVGNKRVGVMRVDGAEPTTIDEGFYVFDVATHPDGFVYTGRRDRDDALLVVHERTGAVRGIGQPISISHEHESAFRNANTVQVDCGDSLIVVGFSALAIVRTLSLDGRLTGEFFVGGDEVDYIRNEAWGKMLTGVDGKTLEERRGIVTASQSDILDDFLALARPGRF